MIESCLYVNHVTSDSFRRYTIIAENPVAIGRQQTVLTERKSRVISCVCDLCVCVSVSAVLKENGLSYRHSVGTDVEIM